MPDWKAEVRNAMAQVNLEPGREQSIVDEVAEHLSEQYEGLVRSGVTEEEAYQRVLEDLNSKKLAAELRPLFRPELASVALGKDEPAPLLEGLGKDLRLAARLLRLNSGFAIVAILSLALGIGANTAIFQLLDAVVLRTLPVSAPQTLADVRVTHQGRIGSTVGRQQEVSSAIWDQLRQQQQAFSSIAAWSTERLDLGHGGEARYVEGLWASGSFFETLRVKPILGRLLSTNDDRKGCGPAGVVISYSFWQSEFGGSANVLGRTLTLNGHAFPIVGITPRTFSGLEVGRKFDVAVPLCSEPFVHPEDNWTNSPITWWLDVIARLKPGWTFQRASAELGSVSPAIFAATLPGTYDSIARKNYLRFTVRAVPAATGISRLRDNYEDPLLLLLAISAVVLLIACANIANLMLARASARQHEMALRLAIGASRARLIRQLLVESLLLSAAGAVAGAVLAYVLSSALILGISTGSDHVFLSLSPDWRVLAFTAGVAILTCVVFGVAPALHAANTEPGAVVKTAGRSVTAARQGLLLRRGFIVGQMAFSLVLVVAALLFVRTFQNLASLNPGFNQDGILVADFDSSRLKIPIPSRLEYQRQLLDQVRAMPGVLSAADTVIVPLDGDGWNEFVDIPGTNVRREIVNFGEVSSDYFRTLGISMLAGRDFATTDTLNAPLVTVVNEAFANKYLGGGNPVGKTFEVRQHGDKPNKVYSVIGLIADTRYRDLHEAPGPIVFVADSQDATPGLDTTILIRSGEPPASIISSLKTVAEKKYPQVVLNFSVMRTSVRERLRRERLMAALSGFYGLLAAMLSVVGLYGMISYTVVLRRSEIGIRMALGANNRRILAMVIGDALKMLVIGLAVGIVLVIATGRAVQAMLFDLKPTDPLTLAVAVAGMALVALAASLLPAQRAATIQPIQTLRTE